MHKIKIFFFVMAFTPMVLLSQETENKEEITKLERVPIYPGCKGNNNETLKKCMTIKVKEHINKKFRGAVIANDENLQAGIYKIDVQIKFNKKGFVEIVDITAPSEASKQETARVIKKLKRVKPGTVDRKPVGVLYSIPITLKKE